MTLRDPFNMSEAAREISRRVQMGLYGLEKMRALDPALESVRVIVSQEMFDTIRREYRPDNDLTWRIGGLPFEPDPCLSLGQMRFRVETVI